jgi:hypothetical protein
MNRFNSAAARPAARRFATLALGASLVVFGARYSTSAAAQSAEIIIDAVQAPAWIQRADVRVPLSPGMRVRDMDEVRTGPGARLLMRAPEGSTVKLGENAIYRVDAQEMTRRNVYSASMNVLQGAFRFTTDVARRFRGKREIDIRLATATAGIRGTDIWGKSQSDREIFCLIEGKVEVTRALGGDEEKPVTLDQPMAFYIAPRDQAALPVGIVDPQQLREWAAETEIQPGRGASRRGGRWNVVLASASSQEEALRVYDAVRGAGYPAEIRPTGSAGKRVYEVRLSQLPSQGEAQMLAGMIRGRFGDTEPTVTR